MTMITKPMTPPSTETMMTVKVLSTSVTENRERGVDGVNNAERDTRKEAFNYVTAQVIHRILCPRCMEVSECVTYFGPPHKE